MDNRYFQDTRAVRPPVVPGFPPSSAWPTEPTLPRVPVLLPSDEQVWDNSPTMAEPFWAGFVYGHGRPPEPPVSPAVGSTDYPPMSPPPWMTDPQRPAGRSIILAVLAAMLVVLVLAMGFLVQRMNLLPAAVPFIGKDTGVAICEVMAKGAGPAKKAGSGQISASDIRELRSMFQDSRYEAIRINGVRMTDVLVQIENMGPDPGFAALAFLGSFADAYAGLAGGCADVGHPLPALPA